MSLGSVPTEQDAAEIYAGVFGERVASVERFPTGLAHYVYDVRTERGRSVVVRLTRPEWRAAFVGASFWYRLLKPRGIPLPRLRYVDFGERQPFPVMIMERLPGTDLNGVYAGLSAEQKRRLADQIVGIQRIAGALPEGPGFGFARSYDDRSLEPSWRAVLEADLARSRRRIEAANAIDPEVVERLRRHLDRSERYFDRIRPTCFLDDTTTKNVIVHDGALSGIVDVDAACFGDPLLTPALTRLALLAQGHDADYVDYWLSALAVTDEQRAIVDLYTALMCVSFLSEIGQTFNTAAPRPADPARTERLLGLFDELLRP